MNTNNYIEHLSEIKDILSKRTKFHALSGLSGIMAGCYALIGAFIAHRVIYTSNKVVYDDIRSNQLSPNLINLFIIFMVVLLAAVITGLYFSSKKAKKDGDALWSEAAVSVLKNFAIPMALGGVFVLTMFLRGYYDIMSATCIAFYGLSLYSASNYTFTEIKYLGLAMIVTSIVSLIFPGYGLYFWAFGFGILHIVYGSLMYFKYEK